MTRDVEAEDTDTEGDARDRPKRSRARRVLLFVVLPFVAVLLLIQLIPNRVTNPPVVQEPKWDSPRTRELAVRACFDCHSNETKVLWFEKVAPLSWWIKNHVDEGRAALNFSEWGSKQGEGGDDAVETVRNGSMPPDYYTWFGLHSDAKLTPAERKELADGLAKTLRASGSSGN
jgi:hypothetical protein